MRDQYYVAPDATELQEALGNLVSVYQEVIFWFEPKGRQPCSNLQEMVDVTHSHLNRLPKEVRAARQRLLCTGFPVPDHWLTVGTNTSFFFDPKPEPYEHDFWKRDPDFPETDASRRFREEAAARYPNRMTTQPYFEFTGLNVTALQQVIREIRLAELKASAQSDQEPPPAPAYHVTLQHKASIVHKSKRSLERWVEKETLPLPDVDGGGGKANLWKWSTVRPILERESGITLPEIFPASQRL